MQALLTYWLSLFILPSALEDALKANVFRLAIPLKGNKVHVA